MFTYIIHKTIPTIEPNKQTFEGLKMSNWSYLLFQLTNLYGIN